MPARRNRKPSKPRSPHWHSVRAAHLKAQPECAACGGKVRLEVHHIEPYHLHPDRELDPANLITLCEAKGHNCHLIQGHLLDWHSFNREVRRDAASYRAKVESRPHGM